MDSLRAFTSALGGFLGGNRAPDHNKPASGSLSVPCPRPAFLDHEENTNIRFRERDRERNSENGSDRMGVVRERSPARSSASGSLRRAEREEDKLQHGNSSFMTTLLKPIFGNGGETSTSENAQQNAPGMPVRKKRARRDSMDGRQDFSPMERREDDYQYHGSHVSVGSHSTINSSVIVGSSAATGSRGSSFDDFSGVTAANGSNAKIGGGIGVTGSGIKNASKKRRRGGTGNDTIIFETERESDRKVEDDARSEAACSESSADSITFGGPLVEENNRRRRQLEQENGVNGVNGQSTTVKRTSLTRAVQRGSPMFGRRGGDVDRDSYEEGGNGEENRCGRGESNDDDRRVKIVERIEMGRIEKVGRIEMGVKFEHTNVNASIAPSVSINPAPDPGGGGGGAAGRVLVRHSTHDTGAGTSISACGSSSSHGKSSILSGGTTSSFAGYFGKSAKKIDLSHHSQQLRRHFSDGNHHFSEADGGFHTDGDREVGATSSVSSTVSSTRTSSSSSSSVSLSSTTFGDGHSTTTTTTFGEGQSIIPGAFKPSFTSSGASGGASASNSNFINHNKSTSHTQNRGVLRRMWSSNLDYGSNQSTTTSTRRSLGAFRLVGREGS